MAGLPRVEDDLGDVPPIPRLSRVGAVDGRLDSGVFLRVEDVLSAGPGGRNKVAPGSKQGPLDPRFVGGPQGVRHGQAFGAPNK
jgi:hypothetical protein